MTTTPTTTTPTTTTPETSRPDGTGVDVAALQGWLTADRAPRLLDVRTPAEFETAHIPGSYNVPLDLLREHRAELRERLEDDVVLVCRSGGRAGQAETLLTGADMPQLHVLRGGVSAWESAGGPLTRGAPRWDMERQVRLVAGGLVLTGVLSSLVLPGAKWLAAAVGGGLTVAAVTDSCAMAAVLSRLPYNRRGTPEIGRVLEDLGADD